MKWTLSIFPVIILMSLLSCRKDNITAALNPDAVYAGVEDSSIWYFEFINPIEFGVVWDIQNLYGFATDSIDLDNDLNYDVVFNLSLLNNDSLHLLTSFPDPFPNFSITPRTGVEVEICREYTYTGMGSGFYSNFVDTLNYNERIAEENLWESGTFSLWTENPLNNGLSFGSWYNLNDIRYVAIKFIDNRYGWIKIDLTDHIAPKIISYALQY